MALQKVTISKIIDKKNPYRSMSIPSITHSYSVCIEYMTRWFLSKFEPNYFGENNCNFYVEGHHAFDDFRKRTKEQLLKRDRPWASLGCAVNLDYDREFIDLYPFGLDMYLRHHSTLERPFFSDDVHNLKLSQAFEILETECTFNIKFSTLAQQIDMYKYCKMAFRVGATQGEDIDYDQHIPYSVMRQIAKDAGFAISNGKIVDVISFLKYMNTHSFCPIMYKFRNINGQDEFFVRVTGAYVHIAVDEMQRDDGDRDGHTSSNYGITFVAKVRFPATKCYLYYSDNEHTEIQLRDNVEGSACFSVIRMIDAPIYNEKMWKQIISTEYETVDVSDVCLEIDMSDLLMPDRLGKVIQHTRGLGISPERFMEIRYFNAGEEVSFNMNWENLKATSYLPLKSRRTFIVCYVDLEYVNNQVEVIKRLTNGYQV